MTSQKMTLTQIWKLMRSRLSDVLVCLRLRGHLDSGVYTTASVFILCRAKGIHALHNATIYCIMRSSVL